MMQGNGRNGGAVPRLAFRAGEAAAACGVSEDFFAAEIGPHVPCVRRGRLKLYSVRALEQWLEENAERLFDDRRAA
jgi:hypothetical protein